MGVKIFIDGTGKVFSVFSDLFELRRLGTASIQRAGWVEPDGQMWRVTLKDGTNVGSFWHREEAIRAEENEVVRRLEDGK